MGHTAGDFPTISQRCATSSSESSEPALLVNKENVVSTNGASKQRRLKTGKQFFVTISLSELYNNVRQDFVANFDDLAVRGF